MQVRGLHDEFHLALLLRTSCCKEPLQTIGTESENLLYSMYSVVCGQLLLLVLLCQKVENGVKYSAKNNFVGLLFLNISVLHYEIFFFLRYGSSKMGGDFLDTLSNGLNLRNHEM